MLPHRLPTLRGLLWIGLLPFTAFLLAVCLFWVVFHRPDWLRILPLPTGIDGQTPDFVARCFETRLSWPSSDANANGAPDWYEASLGLNPRVSAALPQSDVVAKNQYVYYGERTRVRLHLHLDLYYDVRWPRDTEVVITTKDPILLPVESPAGTAPTVGPLRVKASSEGLLEIDVLSAKRRTRFRQGEETEAVYLTVTHARSGLALNSPNYSVFYFCGWRGPARPSRVERRVMDDTHDSGSQGIVGPPEVRSYLMWDPLPGDDETNILEVARADFPEDWIGIEAAPNPAGSVYLLGTLDRRPFPRYKGPLLYRVIPVRQDGPWAQE